MKRASVAALLLIAFSVSCDLAVSPTAPDSGASDGTAAEIRKVLRERFLALSRRDLTAYQRTFDVTQGPLRRCLMETFEAASRLGASSVSFDPNVVRTEPYGRYIRAYVESGLGYQRRYFRRNDAGQLIETEPSADEIGTEQFKKDGGLRVAYWTIDDDVIDALMDASRLARGHVLDSVLAPKGSEDFLIRFYPTRSAAGIVNCSNVGVHVSNTPRDPLIRMYAYGFDRDAKTVSVYTVTVIEHEGLHWAQDQFVPGIQARLPWFLLEGWPDYVSGSRSLEHIRAVVCHGQRPSFKQLSDGPLYDDPNLRPEDVIDYYAYANSMVEFLTVRFGADAYRRFLIVYRDGVNAATNFPVVISLTPDEFYSRWIEFSKQRYC